jgi:hypothetical protein
MDAIRTSKNPLRALKPMTNYSLEGGPLKKHVAQRLIKQRYLGKSYVTKVNERQERSTVPAYFMTYLGKNAQQKNVLPGWEEYKTEDFFNL